MKKSLLTLVFAATTAAISFSQLVVPGPIAFDNVSGGSLTPIFQGSAGAYEAEPGILVPRITGSLTSVDIDAILTATVNGTYANDLMVFVSSSEDLTVAANYLLQVGGFSNFTTNKFPWACGATCDTDVLGTAVGGAVSSFAAMDFTNSTMIIWVGNGYIDANPPTNSGSWTINSISFGGVTAFADVEENTLTSKVYPNPASDDLTIELNTNATSVSIIGMDGKVISTESVNANSVTVNVSALVAGVYVYEIVAENGEVVRNTFVKK
jgi:hypothetical protein